MTPRSSSSPVGSSAKVDPFGFGRFSVMCTDFCANFNEWTSWWTKKGQVHL